MANTPGKKNALLSHRRPSPQPWWLGEAAAGTAWEGDKEGCSSLDCGEMKLAWPSSVCRVGQGALPTRRLLADSVPAPDSPLAH